MKAKLAFAKETRLIPVLVDAMRSGCDEAERVQHYGAQVIDAYIHSINKLYQRILSIHLISTLVNPLSNNSPSPVGVYLLVGDLQCTRDEP